MLVVVGDCAVLACLEEVSTSQNTRFSQSTRAHIDIAEERNHKNKFPLSLAYVCMTTAVTSFLVYEEGRNGDTKRF